MFLFSLFEKLYIYIYIYILVYLQYIRVYMDSIIFILFISNIVTPCFGTETTFALKLFLFWHKKTIMSQ